MKNTLVMICCASALIGCKTSTKEKTDVTPVASAVVVAPATLTSATTEETVVPATESSAKSLVNTDATKNK